MKKKTKFKTTLKYNFVKKKLNSKSLRKIIMILKSENNLSILANLSDKNIKKYLEIVVRQNNMELFVVNNPDLIGYAIIAQKPKYLISNFKKLQISFLLDLFSRLKFLTLINIFISIFNIDLLFISKKKREIINKSVNLNLLGIEKKYQGAGIGAKFLRSILKKTSYKSKYITCETNNNRSTKFYEKKLKFKSIGWKVRITCLVNILSKKIY